MADNISKGAENEEVADCLSLNYGEESYFFFQKKKKQSSGLKIIR